MKKKGDVQVEPIVILSLFVVMLALLGLGYYFYINHEITILKYLPDFNVSKAQGDGLETIGYNIFEGKMKYYDGNDWIDFPADDFELGEKKLNKLITENIFFTFYLENGQGSTKRNEAGKNISLDADTGKEFYGSDEIDDVGKIPELQAIIERISSRDDVQYDTNGYSFGALKIVANIFGKESQVTPRYNRGDVLIWLYDKSGNTNFVYGAFILTINDELKFFAFDSKEEIEGGVINIHLTPSSVASQGLNYMKVKEGAIAWRESVLQHPINIPYIDVEKDKEINNEYFCISKFDNYLVVNLVKPVDASKVCK